MNIQATRTVDTPELILTAARTLLGWTLRRHKTTYNAVEGVRVELHLENSGGAPVARSAFKSNQEWEITEFRCMAHRREASIWISLRRRMGQEPHDLTRP